MAVRPATLARPTPFAGRRFTLRSVGDRLERLGTSDPWAGLGRRRYGLDRAARRLEQVAAATR